MTCQESAKVGGGHGEWAETHFKVAAAMFRGMQMKRRFQNADLELTAGPCD